MARASGNARISDTTAELILRADDDAVVDALLRADKAGIDCPLGWPDEFVDFVVAHRTGQAVEVLTQLVADLRQQASWLDLKGHQGTCEQNDDAFDAVIAAITARAAAIGRTFGPDESQKAAAMTEGWIAVPSAPLSDLIR